MYENLDLEKLLELENDFDMRNITKELKVLGVSLPGKVLVPERKPEAIISQDENGLCVNNVDDYTNQSIEKARKHLTKLGYVVFFEEKMFSESDIMIFAPALDKNGNPKLGEDGGELKSLFMDGIHEEDSLYSDFLSALIAFKRFEDDTSDFVKAHSFLITHPALWHRTSNQKHWMNEAGLDDMHVSVYKNDEGETQVLLEAGPYVEPEYVNRYATPTLDVVKASYEEGILEMADRMLRFYEMDGEMNEAGEAYQSKVYAKWFPKKDETNDESAE